MTTAIDALKQHRQLLQLEYYTEKEAFRKQTEAVGLARKAKRGDAWLGVRVGRAFYNSLGQRALEVWHTQDQEVEHNFEFGRPVVFFRLVSDPSAPAAAKPKISYYAFTAQVSYVDGDRMVVTVPDSAPVVDLQQPGQGIGVQLSFDETSYRTMFDALDRVIAAKDDRLAELRELFYSPQPGATFTFDTPRLPWLNPTQERAVGEVLRAKDVAIVHGPPGTGKTTTLVEAINETLMRESQVMVCAQSNMAVDWISEKLMDRGIEVLRLGNPSRVTDKMLSCCYERRYADHPDYPDLWALRKALREVRSRRGGGGEKLHQKRERLKARITELELRIQADLFGHARVIASTLVGAGNKLLDGRRFTTLFIDEAAQALEAACWIPIRRVSRVVLAGDHCQLPPTVKSPVALKAGLGKTMMERLVELKPTAVTLLGVQYRMNEQIMQFSSDWFYGGKVDTAPQIRHRGILDYDIPIMWLSPEPVDDEPQNSVQEQFVGESFGRINKAEAQLTLDTLHDYLEKIGHERVMEERIDVGVISPYRAQVQYLRQLIRSQERFKRYRKCITVNTVDGFQGQERDIILISLVRSNDEGQIGFLRDLRRMNVAITRARMKLIILGNRETLCRHAFYRKLWDYTQSLSRDKE